MQIRKVISFFNGVPGIVMALVAAAGAFQLYVHAKEKAAVERARFEATVDSMNAAIRDSAIVQASRDSARLDTLRFYQIDAARAKRAASQAAASGRTSSEALHQLLDSNTAARALLDSLETSHATEVASLYSAIAFADSIHRIDSTRIADRDAIIGQLRINLAQQTGYIAKLERAAHPGVLKRILDSPWTHGSFALGGYLLGQKN